jgi:uncharacterized membrane protein YhaH (DUF805 family)
MGFGEAIRTCFRKYVTFSGRARRSEYWYFYLFTVLVDIVAVILDAIVEGATGNAARETFRSSGPFETIVNLALLLPSLAVTVRRLHDTNRSGWLLLGFAGYVIVAIIAFLAMMGASLVADGRSSPGAIAVAVVLMLGGFAYGIFLFVCMLLNGNQGENSYGPDPKGPDIEGVFS